MASREDKVVMASLGVISGLIISGPIEIFFHEYMHWALLSLFTGTEATISFNLRETLFAPFLIISGSVFSYILTVSLLVGYDFLTRGKLRSRNRWDLIVFSSIIVIGFVSYIVINSFNVQTGEITFATTSFFTDGLTRVEVAIIGLSSLLAPFVVAYLSVIGYTSITSRGLLDSPKTKAFFSGVAVFFFVSPLLWVGTSTNDVVQSISILMGGSPQNPSIISLFTAFLAINVLWFFMYDHIITGGRDILEDAGVLSDNSKDVIFG